MVLKNLSEFFIIISDSLKRERKFYNHSTPKMTAKKNYENFVVIIKSGGPRQRK